MGAALEDPFGSDTTDHPLDKYCKATELQVAAVAKMDALPQIKISIPEAYRSDEHGPGVTLHHATAALRRPR